MTLDFIPPWPVNLRRVEERDSALIRRTYQLDAVFLVDAGPESEADAHAPEAERRYFQTTISQFPFLHIFVCLLLAVSRLLLVGATSWKGNPCDLFAQA